VSTIGGLLRRLGFGTTPREARMFDRHFAPVDHPLWSTLDERYTAMRVAMASGQREAIASLLAPQFVSVDVRGNESTSDQIIDSVLRLNIDRSKLAAVTTLIDIEEARVSQQCYSTTP
jgi:hypothetical protein